MNPAIPAKRGGARIGAGRPPLPASERAIAVTISAHPVAVGKFRAHCQQAGISQRKQFEAWIGKLG